MSRISNEAHTAFRLLSIEALQRAIGTCRAVGLSDADIDQAVRSAQRAEVPRRKRGKAGPMAGQQANTVANG